MLSYSTNSITNSITNGIRSHLPPIMTKNEKLTKHNSQTFYYLTPSDQTNFKYNCKEL